MARDRGRLDVDAPVADTVSLPAFEQRSITWKHLLHQTSNWQGELWGKPTAADAQSHEDA